MRAPTIKQLSSRHTRRLETLNKQILDMSCDWEDLDQFNMNVLMELHDKVKAVLRDLKQTDNADQQKVE